MYLKTQVQIISERFLLRELTENDVTDKYLSWFDESEAKKFITAANKIKDLLDLKIYVRNHVGKDDVLFLGIFERDSDLHIGNIKFDPVDDEESYAIMGLLIGDNTYRGKGVASEVLKSSAQWLKMNRNISQIILGVSKDNHSAIRAYEKIGFVFSKTKYLPHHPSTMIWELTNL